MINDEKKQIYNWINPCFKFKTKLLYRCSIDGDSSCKFHEKCDGKGPTITLVKKIKDLDLEDILQHLGVI